MRAWLRRRLADRRRLRNGLLALTGIAVAYGLSILLLALGGAWPSPAPWLDLPLATYFYWEAAFIGPVIFAGAILAAAAMHLVARGLGGRGSFEDTMALVGSATALATTTTVVPDTVIGLLLCAGIVRPEAWMAATTHATLVLGLVWVYLTLYLIAFLTLFPAVLVTVHRLPLRRAIPAGVGGFLLYQLLLFVFVR